ncbi:L,D-transpeptidase, partial [Salmonella enterica subsp. enterica serovar Infantis]
NKSNQADTNEPDDHHTVVQQAVQHRSGMPVRLN